MRHKFNNSLLHLTASILLLSSSSSLSAQTWPEGSATTKPGSRWWWMGSAVDKENLRWNMGTYAKTGIGALEITPIYGVKDNERNELQFLSPSWMEMLRFTEDEGRRKHLLIDMNTGTGWPFGGPTVSLKEAAAKVEYRLIKVSGKELRQGVDIRLEDKKERQYAQLSRVMAYDQNGGVFNLTDITEEGVTLWKKARKKDIYDVVALYCSRTRQQVKRAAPGGEGYVLDHFDRDAVKHYLERFTTAFENTKTPWPHTFFNDSYEVYKANWTPTLLEEFAKRRGYLLESHLLELFGEREDKDNKVLSDYRETLGELLLENFTMQWTAWAHLHGAKTRNQAHGSPANLIDIYAAVDIPEIEGFGLSDFGIKGLRRDSGFTRKNDSDVSMLKYASSAAHVTGKQLTSSETLTWLTEHFRTSLSQCKPDIDLMFTCGVNNMYFHGTTYSPKDEPWPGWKFYASIDMSSTNSIWKDAPFLMKYIDRCQRFLQMGKADNDFLVLLPVRDMWAERHGKGAGSLLMQFDIHSMAKKAPEFIKSILEIDKAGFDCDYISERLLLNTHYENGCLQTEAGTRYKALIIPGSGKMNEKTLAHINEMKAQGATIIYGIDREEMGRHAKAEKMKIGSGLRAIRRSNATGHHYFIANLSPNDIDHFYPLAVDYKDARWFNPLNGEIYAAEHDSRGVRIQLRSGESMILQTYHEMLSNSSPVQPQLTDNIKEINGAWQLTFVNTQPEVNKTFHLSTPKTWETLDDDSVKVCMGTGCYSTTITMTAKEAASTWMIDLGDVRESAHVYVNEQLIGCAWSVPYLLHCGKAFKQGTNTLRIEVTNLPANRIADMDRRGVNWRRFKDTNIVSIDYKKKPYNDWSPVKSGLNSCVRLIETK